MTSIGSLQPGDRVRSRWSSSGAIWEVVELYPDQRNIRMRSVKTGREDIRQLSDLQLA